MSTDSPQITELKTKFFQTRNDLEHVRGQLHEVTVELDSIERSEELLKKVDADDTVYRRHAYAMVKSTRDDALSDMEELRALANTKNTVLKKQAERLQNNLKEYTEQLTKLGL